MYIITDLDNCISDDQWRLGRIVPKNEWTLDDSDMARYHDYHQLCAFDEAANLTRFGREKTVIIMTSRPVIYRTITIEWLSRVAHFDFCDKDADVRALSQKPSGKIAGLYMRDPKDLRPSINVKAAMLNDFCKRVSRDQIFIAYDDRQEIVDMYQACGVHAKRLYINDREER